MNLAYETQTQKTRRRKKRKNTGTADHIDKLMELWCYETKKAVLNFIDLFKKNPSSPTPSTHRNLKLDFFLMKQNTKILLLLSLLYQSILSLCLKILIEFCILKRNFDDDDDDDELMMSMIKSLLDFISKQCNLACKMRKINWKKLI